LFLARAPRPDAIYLNVWPLISQGILSWIARLRRIPVILSIQDVYPESLVALKMLRSGTRIAKLLRWLDTSIALNASAVIVISKTVENTYLHDRGIARGKVHLIANWKTAENLPSAESSQIKGKEWGVEPGATLLVFAGNVASACGIENVISVISALSDESPVQLVIAGSGSALASCREIADLAPSGKVKFTGAFQVEDTLSILSAGDILLLPTQGDQSLVSMPSKLISYMMSARPILAIACLESDLASVVRESGCGWVIPPGDSDGLSLQLEVCGSLGRPELARMGALGREYALTNFSTEACLPKLVAVVESAGMC
jgi:glycosyltransferase involved in cell wall biosynthesis